MEILGQLDVRLTQNLYTRVYDPAKTAGAEALARIVSISNVETEALSAQPASASFGILSEPDAA